jgi:hypothetical protein
LAAVSAALVFTLAARAAAAFPVARRRGLARFGVAGFMRFAPSAVTGSDRRRPDRLVEAIPTAERLAVQHGFKIGRRPYESKVTRVNQRRVEQDRAAQHRYRKKTRVANRLGRLRPLNLDVYALLTLTS